MVIKVPSCPRGWLAWAAYVQQTQGSVRSVLYEHQRGDRRLSDSRETALDVMMMLERAAKGNGGAELLYRVYVLDAPWISFTEPEKATIRITTRRFVALLVRAGFMREGD